MYATYKTEFYGNGTRAIRWETLKTAESVTAASLSAWKVSSWMGVRECLRLEIADGE